MKRFIALVMIMVLCIGLLAGCGQKSTSGGGNEADNKTVSSGDKQTPSKPQIFSFSTLDEPKGLNPVLNSTEPDYGVQRLILESLIYYVADENGVAIIKPGVAKDWTMNDDGTVYTFYIRDDAVWSDDVPVKAEDFVFTFRQMATPKVASTNAWLFDDIILNFTEAHYNEGKTPEDIGVKAIDEKTVQFTLTNPTAYFVQLLDRAKPVRQDKWEEWGEKYGSSVDKTLTNGIFKLDEWQPNVKMIFSKSEKYWDAATVKLEKINRYIVEEPSAAIQALLTEQIDVVGTNDPDWQGEIEQQGDKYRKINTVGNAPEFYSFNAANKYFKNPKIRIAFSIAIDRDKYNEDLNHGASSPLYSLVPEVVNCGDQLYKDLIDGDINIVKKLQEQYPDPKALLIEGLIEEGFDPDPSKMEIRYATRGTGEYSKKSAEWLLQEYQEKLGVTITIDLMEWNIMWDKMDQGDYDISTAGWTPDYNDPNTLISIYDPINGYFNSTKSGWVGPDADRFHELMVIAAESTDNKVRADAFFEAEQLLVGKAIIAPVYSGRGTTYVSNKIKGYSTSPNAGVDYTKIYIE